MASKIPVIKFRREHPSALLPEKARESAVGFDIAVLGSITLPPSNLTNRVHTVSTGISFDIPEGYYATVSLRNTWAQGTKVRLANGVAVINSDNKGEVILYLENLGKYEQRIMAGQYIAEVIFHKKETVKLELNESPRNEGGTESGY